MKDRRSYAQNMSGFKWWWLKASARTLVRVEPVHIFRYACSDNLEQNRPWGLIKRRVLMNVYVRGRSIIASDQAHLEMYKLLQHIEGRSKVEVDVRAINSHIFLFLCLLMPSQSKEKALAIQNHPN